MQTDNNRGSGGTLFAHHRAVLSTFSFLYNAFFLLRLLRLLLQHLFCHVSLIKVSEPVGSQRGLTSKSS